MMYGLFQATPPLSFDVTMFPFQKLKSVHANMESYPDSH